MTVLITRPEADSREVAAALAGRGVPCLVWPLTRIVFTEDAVSVPPGCRGLVVTSANGLRAFAALRPERDLPVLAVGERTARLARELGFAETESADGDARALAALARRLGRSPLLHPRGRERAFDLVGAFAAAGIEVVPAVLYAAVPNGPPPARIRAALGDGTIRVVTLWSPRNASLFSALCRDHGVDPAALTAVAISPAAARPLADLGLAGIEVASRPDRAAMLDAIVAADAAMRR